MYVHKRHFRTDVREETWSLRYSRHVLKFEIIIIMDQLHHKAK